MKKILSIVPLFILLSHMVGLSVYSEEPDKELMEEIIILGLHEEISRAIKEKYDTKIAQYEDVEILSITKEAQYEPSEEMKPGMIYEMVIKVLSITNSGKESLIITLINEQSSFKVTNVKPLTIKK